MKLQKIVRNSAAGVVLAGLTVSGTMAHADSTGMMTAESDLLNATLWMQTSVEFKANSMAAYKLAEVMLDRALADKSWTAALEQDGDYQGKPPAVILDVDETVLDNSVYEAWLIKARTNYSSKTWMPFVDDAVSTPIAGSKEFIDYARSKGVEIFYVSNRKAPGEEGTRKNLKDYGYYVNDKVDTVLLRGEKEDWGSEKSTRRAHVAKDYRVLLLLGDNLGDFVDIKNADLAERNAILARYQENWSSKWITIANPMYGSWEGAAFGFQWKASDEQKRQLKMNAMKYWAPAE
ncbi:5'-nucleotidase, lipoprotein e(P4) family [Sneathiella chinensis]|uniref:Acid phosphatase n=1 Tax=Sneathiella chinensis TaxID=349750 RepID=A0ABQ5U3J1_9PROT|nr:HAD family acid phosphatase [Sneathiella chinensis]GLQ06735.1 acid phosphatase [Sneathiella chinensis]